MSRTPRQHFVALGPAVPVVGVGGFSKMNLPAEEWDEVWKIIGPSVERNMTRRRAMPLWMVIAAAYLEGIHHGSALSVSDGSRAAGKTGTGLIEDDSAVPERQTPSSLSSLPEEE